MPPVKNDHIYDILEKVLQGNQGFVNTTIGLCIKLQRATGARISEILAMEWQHIDDQGNVYVRQAKRGISHVVRCPDLLPLFSQMREAPDQKVIRLTYRQVYSLYLKLGICYNPGNTRKHNAVCHLPRRQKAQQIFIFAENNAEAAGHCLGHRSKKSINYYLTKEQINAVT